MNFGLTIITICYIVILIVPGIFFKKFYFQSKFNHEFHAGAFADKIITSLFWGLLVQIICILSLKVCFSLTFDDLYLRLNNLYISIHKNELPKLSYKQLKYLSSTFLLSIFIACLSGHILHKIIRFFRLDIKFSPLRFANEWNYIFRNEQSEDIKPDALKQVYHSTEIDIIVKESKNDIPRFYSGVLKDYFLTETGQLDRICLTLAKKRPLNNESGEFRDIKGDTFIIPYCNIENMNLRYNYTYKPKGWKVSIAIKNTILLISIIFLITLLIAPWFTQSSIWAKLISTLLLFIGWTSILTLIVDFFEEKRKLKLINYFILGILSFITTISSLDILNVFNIIEYLKRFNLL